MKIEELRTQLKAKEEKKKKEEEQLQKEIAEVKKQESQINVQDKINAIKQKTEENKKKLEEEQKKAKQQEEKQQQARDDYLSNSNTDEMNKNYSNYMQSVGNTLNEKMENSNVLQELSSKKNVITPQEVAKAEDFETTKDNVYNAAKTVYNVVGSTGYAIGRTPAKLVSKALFNINDNIWHADDYAKKRMSLIKEGKSIPEVEKEMKVFRQERKDKIQDAVNQLDAETIEKYGNMETLVNVANTASDLALASMGANALAKAGVNPLLASATAHGIRGNVESRINTNDKADIAVDTAISAGFGVIDSLVNQTVIKGIEKYFPTTSPLSATTTMGKMVLKNAIAGGTGTYTATATTGELRNTYNKLRGREVTKEDWIKPVWSTETAVSTLVGAGLGAYSGTKTDLKVRAKYEQDVNILVKKLEVYANKFNEAIQNGDQQSALDIVRTSRDKLVQFSMNDYGGRTVDSKVMNEVANKWKTYLENTTEYYNFVYNDMNANVNGQGKLGSSTLKNLRNKYNTNVATPNSQTLREKYSMPTKLSIDTVMQNDYTKINLGETKNVSTSKLMELYTGGGERTTEQINSLREDIKNNGITEPIEISQKSDGTYTIENGNHRLQIANELGINEVPVKMVESWDSFVSRLKQNYIQEGAKSEYETNNTITNTTNTTNEKSWSGVGLLRDSTEPFGSGRGTTTDVGISTGTSNSNEQTSSNENQRINREKDTVESSNKSSFSNNFAKDDFIEKEFNNQETVLSDFTKRTIIEIVADDIENYVQNKEKITNAELNKYIEHLDDNAYPNAELERYYREDVETEDFNAWKEAKKIYKNTIKSALKELGYEYDNKENAFVKHNELSTNNTRKINETYNEFNSASKNIDRSIVVTIANDLNVPISHNGQKIETDMKEKAGHNQQPKIIEITKLFEDVTDKNAKEYRNQALEKALELFRNTETLIKDTDSTVEIKFSGIDKTFSGKVTESKIQSADNIKDIIEEGIYLYSTKNIHDENGIVYHHFFAPINYNNSNGLMRVVIKEYINDRTLKDRYYYHQLEYIDTNKKDTNSALPRKIESKDGELVSYVDNSISKNKNVVNNHYMQNDKKDTKKSEKSNTLSDTDILKSKKNSNNKSDYIVELLSNREFVKSRIKERLEVTFEPLIENKIIGNSVKNIINSESDRIELLIKLNAMNDEKINDIINEMSNMLLINEKGNEQTLKETAIKKIGVRKWNEIIDDTTDVLNKIKNNFNKAVNEGTIESAKKDVIKLLKELNKSQKLNVDTEAFMNGYANEYEQKMYSDLLDEFIYYSRPLEEIEAYNYAGIKKTNYLIEKRRWDLQHSGKTTSNEYKNGATWSDMRKVIEKHLNKSLKLKGFRQRAYGIYKPSTDEIRIKDISDIETAIHELGHRFDFKEIKRLNSDEINMELEELCTRAFQDTYKDDPDATLREGWAEFVRRFIANNEVTINEYPYTTSFFRDAIEHDKKLRDTVVTLTNMVEQHVHASTNSVISNMISVGEQTDKTVVTGIRNKIINWFENMMTNWFDDKYLAKKLTRLIAKGTGGNMNNMNPENNVYNSLRLQQENADKIKNILLKGFYDDNGVLVVKGLGRILEPFEVKNSDVLTGKSKEKIKKLTEIRVLLVARRNLDYLVKNLGSGIGVTDTINAITTITDRDVINAVEEIEEFANYPYELAYKHGMISQEEYEETKKWNKFYVPLNRVFEEEVTRLGSAKNPKGITKQRTGSERDIVDPLESIVNNTAIIMQKVAHNDVMQTLSKFAELPKVSDYYSIIALPQKLKASISLESFKKALQEQLGTQNVEDLGIDFDVIQKIFSPKLSDDRTRTLTFMENGELKAIQFHNQLLYDIFNGSMGKSETFAHVLKVFDNMTGILRAGATAHNVEFALPNMTSDTFVAWVSSDAGFIPVIDTIKGAFEYLIADQNWGNPNTENKRIYDYYQQSGATMATRVGSYRADVQNMLKEVLGKHITEVYSDDPKDFKKVMKELWEKAKELPNGIQDVLSFIPELSEQATRFGYFKKSYKKWIKKGYTHKQAQLKAGIDTKDVTLDFNRAGRKMRVINQAKAFANAKVQGLYKTVEMLEKHPIRTTAKATLLAVIWGVLAGAVAKELEEINEQIRKENYVLKIGNTIIKIKKPQEFYTKTFLNLAETEARVANGADAEKEWSRFFSWLADDLTTFIDIDTEKGVVENIGVNLQDTALEPVVEVTADHDFYYGNQITPYGTENNSSQYQYDAYTSETAKRLGQTQIAKSGKVSPAQIEHLIEGYGAGVGQQALDISDSIIDYFDDDVTLPKKNASESFITRRFVVDPNKNSQSVSEIYEMYEKLNTKNEDSEYNGISLTEEEQETFDKLKQAKDDFSIINKQLREIQTSLSYSAEEKQDKMNELRALRTDVARYYLGRELIDPNNEEQIELYEYYPASEEYTYTPPKGMKTNVTFTDEEKNEYAKLFKQYYEESADKIDEEIEKFRKQNEEAYEYATGEERKNIEKQEKNIRQSFLDKARTKATDEMKEKAYKRMHNL